MQNTFLRKGVKDLFEFKLGLRQGDGLIHTIFNIELERVLRDLYEIQKQRNSLMVRGCYY